MQCAYQMPVCCTFVLLGASLQVVAYKLQHFKDEKLRCITSSLKVIWHESMKWNAKENFSMEWKTKWKIFRKE